MCRHSQSSRDAAWSRVILDQIAQLSALYGDRDDNVCVSLIQVCRTLSNKQLGGFIDPHNNTDCQQLIRWLLMEEDCGYYFTKLEDSEDRELRNNTASMRK